MATHRVLLGPLRSHLLPLGTATRRSFTTALPLSLHQPQGSPSVLTGFSVYSVITNSISIWAAVWESILRAVPKKKTSHSKKRSRFLAGKALKDVTSLNRCSGCGNVKRAHLLCPYCVKGIPQPKLFSTNMTDKAHRNQGYVEEAGREVRGSHEDVVPAQSRLKPVHLFKCQKRRLWHSVGV